MTLGEKQECFVELEQQWVAWVLAQGWKLRHGEGRILQLGPDGKTGRKAKLLDGSPVRVRDGVHMDEGTHYMGVGADWQLFVLGVWISMGTHPAWKEAGEKWESLHELCRWGGRFGETAPGKGDGHDANHISIEHNGKQ